MPESRPNIVVFNPDQWRGDVMHHMGNPAAVTPNLDALAATEGVSFRNAFAQATVCTPSRCSFMTGWYPHTRGHRTMHYMLRERDNEPNLLRLLKDNGYFVWWGGKNDLVAGQEGYEEHAHASFRPSPADFERWGYERQPGSHGGDLSWRGAPDDDTLSRARAPARQAAGGQDRRARDPRPAHGTDRLHGHGLRAGGDRPGVLALRTFPDAAVRGPRGHPPRRRLLRRRTPRQRGAGFGAGERRGRCRPVRAAAAAATERGSPLPHSKAAFCRTATHKYVKRCYERDALYDLVADPMETRNRIDDREARNVLLELKERMLDWYMSTCDIVPMDPDSRWLIRPQ